MWARVMRSFAAKKEECTVQNRVKKKILQKE